MTSIRMGLCGFSMAFDAYVREFPLVEVQQTFYEPPSDGTLRRWRSAAPAAFEFTIKAWQLVTHESSSPTYRRLRRSLTAVERKDAGGFRTSPIVLDAWQRTLRCAEILRATAVLLQCPRSFGPTDANIARMREFLSSVDRPTGLRVLWEPRGPWPMDVVGRLCDDLSLVHVVDPFVSQTVTPDTPYFRLHGISGARHVYRDEELRNGGTTVALPCRRRRSGGFRIRAGVRTIRGSDFLKGRVQVLQRLTERQPAAIGRTLDVLSGDVRRLVPLIGLTATAIHAHDLASS